MSEQDQRRRGDGADEVRDREIHRRAMARVEAGQDWVNAMADATQEVATGPRVRTAGRRPSAGRSSLTAAIAPRDDGARAMRIDRSAEGTPAAPAEAAALAGSLAGGSALPSALRRELERALGIDLAPVRIHTDGAADQAARALGARAFAVGHDIGFRAGEYDPARPEGVRLIAHEVAHTVQTRGAAAPDAAQISEPGDASEREADAFADAFVAPGSRGAVPLATPGHVTSTPAPAAARPAAGEWAAGDPSRSLWSLAHDPAGGIAAATRVQLARILDYADPARPEHDPSRISDALIEATNEYRSLMNPRLIWQTRDHVTATEARLACRLVLRVLRSGGHVNWERDARTWVMQARQQSATAGAAEGMNNQLHWTNQAVGLTNTEFGRWLLSGGPEPSGTTGDMNCWELVMFSAYRAGFTTQARLAAIYTTFAAGVGADVATGVTAFETAIRRGPEQTYVPANPDSPRPVRGDLVIFGTVANHAAVATGNYPGGKVEIMSLWTQNSRRAFRTTVEDLIADGAGAGPYRFFAPSW